MKIPTAFNEFQVDFTNRRDKIRATESVLVSKAYSGAIDTMREIRFELCRAHKITTDKLHIHSVKRIPD